LPNSFLLPTPETLPAHWLLLEVLENLTFTLHILLVNIVLGGSIILLWTRAFSRQHLETAPVGSIYRKIPTVIAYAITLGVAPLLFAQVTYGHLFYTSSVLMGFWWILIIPLLIIAYYAAYGQCRAKSNMTAVILTLAMTGIFLYISFMLTTNNTLMLHPEYWNKYFFDRHGTHLNLTDPTLIPRWLHFVIASVAIGGLFSAVVWHFKGKKGAMEAGRNIKTGLKIFAYATIVQILDGLWFLCTLPSTKDYMGGDWTQTVVLALGILLAAETLVHAFKGKVMVTAIHTMTIVILMVVNRALLRYSYLEEFFRYEDLELKWQFTPLALFLVVFIAGLFIVYQMLSTIWKIETGRNN